jgi:myo-inositol 2-dehydrogenase/D-chiro-inositol 1-dehydrogenase
MQFALLGDHPDAVSVALAVLASGNHRLGAADVHGAKALAHLAGNAEPPVDVSSDLEEILANPSVEAVIVGTALSVRAATLRRAMQSERHVLCVHPADQKPDVAYEAALIQGDTGKVLQPILFGALHPAVAAARELLLPRGGAGSPRLIQIDRVWKPLPSMHDLWLPSWEVVRALGGEITELQGFAQTSGAAAAGTILLQGRFASTVLLHATLRPEQATPAGTFRIEAERGEIQLDHDGDWTARVRLAWSSRGGIAREMLWESWNAGQAALRSFEEAIAGGDQSIKPTSVTWRDETRALELDDAARRSMQKGRVSVLEYAEASPEQSFKGTMTLIGCGLIWLVFALYVASAWVLALGYLIPPLLLIFLVLQILRFVARGNRQASSRVAASPGPWPEQESDR